MIPIASGLLRLVGGGASADTSSLAPAPTGDVDFASLLEKARTGEIHSGRQVTIGSRANVELTQDQLLRLSAAADLAEAQGATRALVLLDGQALRIDVSMREVTEAVNLAKPGVLTNIDAVVTVPGQEGGGDEGRGSAGAAIVPPPGGGRPWSNASLLKALDDNGKRQEEEAR